jgi:hypothetical protein
MLLIVFAVLFVIDVLTIRAMAVRRAGVVWWVALAILLVAGGVGGVWAAMHEWQPTERLRVIGFPLAVGVWKLEGDQWIDYVSPLGPLVPLFNVVAFLIASVLPLSVAYAVRRLWVRPLAGG